MKRSTSMSLVDGCVGTWPKEKRFVPALHRKCKLSIHQPTYQNSFFCPISTSPRGISFEIPLDGDSAALPCDTPSARGMTRSASSDGLGFKGPYACRGGMRRHLSLTPVTVNGRSRHIPEEDEDFPTHRPLGRNNTFSIKDQSRCRRELQLNGTKEMMSPSTATALKA